ncbi:alanine--tRNA ligase-related protein [Dactylosporangium sp. AC04546]|uniref:alanine--tRNA ligase-related protein n=1 Tax=Dactylosporangium sp. AC04546 TaxID=2862460 RepID=UPI001EE10847|nr:alanine--tRNA ligase-related protein [Dactylosporangium sp. AC04546]WVK87354.1 alanine--tRNA ligase-related protein [Dactylosporangium sp. AC04546]
MTSTSRIVDTFLDFYRERGHALLTDATLITPDGDPVLFTSAGMHPLTPYLEGRPHPLGRRLAGLQRCLRTTDLDEVGDDTHLTVFQMLGSWSLGDYPGEVSLRWGYELLRDGFGVPTERLHVTVFDGDERSLSTWERLGVPAEVLGEADNWWSNGPTGPCGPDSEIFVWTGEGPPTGTPSSDRRWVEVWNHVMMRYRRNENGDTEPLGQSGVDTGMGLERMAMVLQGCRSVFDIDVFEPWTRAVTDRVVADHLRSSVVVVGDGVHPSNTGRGYVLRRLVRRVLTRLWRDDPKRSLGDLPIEPIVATVEQFRLRVDPEYVRDVLVYEERRFGALLRRGRPLVERLLARGPLTDDDLHYLHDTHGIPRDLVEEVFAGNPV